MTEAQHTPVMQQYHAIKARFPDTVSYTHLTLPTILRV